MSNTADHGETPMSSESDYPVDIPDFQTEQEERDFWSTHDSARYFSRMEVVTVTSPEDVHVRSRSIAPHVKRRPSNEGVRSEAFSRTMIDAALRDSGWDISNRNEVGFEVLTSTGRADYVLRNSRGPLCIIEAKKLDADPYDAKEQARGYAENMNVPFIVLSNGREHWFWNLQRIHQEDAYRIERLPSLTDLERLRLKGLQPPRRLGSDVVERGYLQSVNPDITLRRYQSDGVNRLSKQFDNAGRRKFLFEMATGTGKTLLCAALIRHFLVTRNAERVLFIVDRIELAKQTLEEFSTLLREYKPVIYKNARRHPGELLGSSVVIATVQSLMVDRRFREEFTPFFFDLVINDEAHRSIYGDSREVVQFFQATRVGLTATPKAYLRNVDIQQLGVLNPKTLEARELRDTYHYFGCEPGEPTFRYDIIDAVTDPEGPFLCMPKIINIRSDITTQALSDMGWSVTVDEKQENYKVQDLERKIFTPRRNQLMCEAFLQHAQRDPEGHLGKSIIFAVNQTHATRITQILNELQPGIAVTITSRVRDASDIAKEFRDGKRLEKVAVSVDMLSTGYNCRDLLNVVLMRPIFSPTEYIQIKGRGTRLYTFHVGNTEYEKRYFFLLDFCGVAEFFEEKYDYSIPLPIRPAEGKKSNEAERPGNVTASVDGQGTGQSSIEISGVPIWEGRDEVVFEEVRLVGPEGEKVDVMTFRGSFEEDLREFAMQDADFSQAVALEDDDVIDEILQERFFHKPQMYYSSDKLVVAYGVPAPTSAFVYDALKKRPLPSREQIIRDTVDSIAARFNLRYGDQQWLNATAHLIVEDPTSMERFKRGDMTLFTSSRFNQLGGLSALAHFSERNQVFDALRQSSLVLQLSIGVSL